MTDAVLHSVCSPHPHPGAQVPESSPRAGNCPEGLIRVRVVYGSLGRNCRLLESQEAAWESFLKIWYEGDQDRDFFFFFFGRYATEGVGETEVRETWALKADDNYCYSV